MNTKIGLTAWTVNRLCRIAQEHWSRCRWYATFACLFALQALGCDSFESSPGDLLRSDQQAGNQQPKFQVMSSSMMPHVLGPTHTASCSQCRHSFLVAADTFRMQLPLPCVYCAAACELNGQWVCEDCGEHFDHSMALDGHTVPDSCPACGGRIWPVPNSGTLVDALHLSPPAKVKRFDVLLFDVTDDQSSSSKQMVKRVWGLPGEHIEFRVGDLWINGQLYQKSLSELTRVAVPVCTALRPFGALRNVDVRRLRQSDDSLRPDSETVWLAPGETYSWTYMVPQAMSQQQGNPTSLENVSDGDFEMHPSAIFDDLVGNQGLSYPLLQVDDFLMHFLFQIPIVSPLKLAFEYKQRTHELWIFPDGQAIPEGLRDRSLTASTSVTLACCDGQILLRTDTHPKVLTQRLEPLQPTIVRGLQAGAEFPVDRGPFCVRLESPTDALGINQLKSISLGRDVYLRADVPKLVGFAPRQSWQVPAGSYFVLGDNLPASDDSRFTLGMVRAAQLRGLIRRPTGEVTLPTGP